MVTRKPELVSAFGSTIASESEATLAETSSGDDFHAESSIDWSDQRTQEALKGLKDVKDKGLKSRCQQDRLGLSGQNAEFEENRAVTPTQEDPHSRRSQQAPSKFVVEMVTGGTGGFESIRMQLGNSIPKESQTFLLVFTETSQLKIASDESRGDSGSPFGMGSELPTYSLLFAPFPSPLDNDIITIEEIDEDDRLSECSENTGQDPKSQNSSMLYGINSFDVMQQFQDCDVAVIEVSPKSLSKTLQSGKLDSSSLSLVNDVEIPSRSKYGEEIFAQNGEIEEWMAHDDSADDLDGAHGTTTAYRRRGLPPVSPRASIRQDIMSHLFDDVWSEITPSFQPLLDNFIHGASQGMDPEPQMKSNYAILDADTDEEDSSLIDSEGLLSAMTIRPVPLQKRESSAKVRSSFDSIPSEMLQGSRPASARPLSGKVSITRPTSARNLESLQQQHSSQSMTRLQSAAGIRSNARNWKRNNPGMRLLPLAALPANNGPSTLTDVILGTSIGLSSNKTGAGSSTSWETSRPSTSVASSTKRLPPIRHGSGAA
ncbi:hypothetical protein HDU76_001797 [Blyttiomyces sp. JEL0837]|nr:hypothetical protein HDU76_001797 [Blyttiomyces sp. JEL0837]